MSASGGSDSKSDCRDGADFIFAGNGFCYEKVNYYTGDRTGICIWRAQLILQYETLHSPQHWPLIGYGHMVQPGEKYRKGQKLPEQQADALLRKDLKKFADLYSAYGKDSLLLGVLAYNVGPGRVNKSPVVRLLKSGDRNIREAFEAMCRYKGKVHKQIRARRIEEFQALFRH